MKSLVKILVFIWVLLLTFQVPAAESDYNETRATRKERKADKLYYGMAYQSAVDLYLEALSKSPERLKLHLKLAEAYVRLNDTEKAEQHYRQYISKGKLSAPEKLNYARVLQTNNKLTEAEVWALAYQQEVPRSRIADNLVSSIKKNDSFYRDSAYYQVSAVNFNTDQAEFGAAYYQDELVFASSRKQGMSIKKKYHWDDSHYLDLYQVDPTEAVSDPAPVKDLNTKFHEGSITFFDNDRQAIFTRSHYQARNSRQGDNTNTLQLYHAIRSEDGRWEQITPLPFNHPDHSTGHPTMENNVLYYASNKEGGYGGVDLYKVTYEDGKWGRPRNLGPQINTEGDEQFPFIHNGTLYFASNAHEGLGGLDIFSAELLDDGTIQNIRNLGYPINSRKDDFGLITKNGKKGYFSSNRSGNDDLYDFELLGDLPEDVIVASLQDESVEMEEISKLPESLTENTENAANGELSTIRNAEMIVLGEEENQQIYLLADQQVVELSTEADGTYLQGERISESHQIEDLSLALAAQGITISEEYQVNTIYYGFDKSEIREESARELDKLVVLLNTHADLKINLDSHTDSRGSSSYNEALAQRRSQAARQYLIDAGIDAQRLTATAQGENDLLNNCDGSTPCSENDHQKNRRTQFSLIL